MMFGARRISIVVVALTLLVAACGDDDVFGEVATSSGESTTATIAPDDETTTTRAGGTTTTAGGATTSEVTPPGGDEDIAALLEEYRSVPLRVTYLVGGDTDAQTITLSQDPTQTPPVTAVILYESPEPESPEEAKVLTIGDRTLICGPPGPENTCVETPPTPGGGPSIAEGLLGPLVSAFLLELELSDAPGFSVDPSGITLAGREGICFTYTPTAYLDADVAFLRQCVDTESGFTLLLEAKEPDGETVERVMELIDFGQPQPGDFEPTGEVISMPSG
jgi:hypothetical protein